MSDKKQEPSRRTILKLPFAFAVGLPFAEQLAAQGKNGNPYFSKDREAQIKQAHALKYKRDIDALTAMSKGIGKSESSLLVLDSDQLDVDRIEHNLKANEIYKWLLPQINGNEKRAQEETGHLATQAGLIQNGSISGGVVSLARGNTSNAKIVLLDTRDKKINFNDKIGILPIISSRDTDTISIQPGYGNIETVGGAGKRKIQQTLESQTKNWGMKDDFNAPIYTAFRDYTLMVKAADAKRPLAMTADETMHRNAVAEAFATLKIAQQFGVTYPSRMMAAASVTRAVHQDYPDSPYTDTKKPIRMSVPLITSHVVNLAADFADESMKTGMGNLRAMTDADLFNTAENIADQKRLSGAQIEYLSDKCKNLGSGLRLSDIKGVQATLNDKSLLNGNNPLDKMIIDTHLLLFSKLKAPQLSAVRG